MEDAILTYDTTVAELIQAVKSGQRLIFSIEDHLYAIKGCSIGDTTSDKELSFCATLEDLE